MVEGPRSPPPCQCGVIEWPATASQPHLSPPSHTSRMGMPKRVPGVPVSTRGRLSISKDSRRTYAGTPMVMRTHAVTHRPPSTISQSRSRRRAPGSGPSISRILHVQTGRPYAARRAAFTKSSVESSSGRQRLVFSVYTREIELTNAGGVAGIDVISDTGRKSYRWNGSRFVAAAVPR